MRILVFSDSHGITGFMRTALFDHPKADAVIFLGDGERDFNALGDILADKRTVKVCGNCDYSSSLPINELVTLGGVKIFCSHGAAEHVKYGDDELAAKASGLGARIALYGHTHRAVTDYRDGLYIMNPGSAATGDYGIIDIVPGGIMCSCVSL